MPRLTIKTENIGVTSFSKFDISADRYIVLPFYLQLLPNTHNRVRSNTCAFSSIWELRYWPKQAKYPLKSLGVLWVFGGQFNEGFQYHGLSGLEKERKNISIGMTWCVKQGFSKHLKKQMWVNERTDDEKLMSDVERRKRVEISSSITRGEGAHLVEHCGQSWTPEQREKNLSRKYKLCYTLRLPGRKECCCKPYFASY